LPLFVGFGIAATGGPLALAALYVPGAVSSVSSIGLVAVLAVVAFGIPVAVWHRYSQTVVSSGGLFAFVDAAVGRPVALVQGGVWIISYFLYLPYTITYIVYDLLPVVLPGLDPYRPFLEVALPLAISALALVRIRRALVLVAVIAIFQLGVLVALVVVGTAHVGVPTGVFRAHGQAALVAHRAAAVSLLFVCTSLPLFLGGETTGRSPTVRRGLAAGFILSGMFVTLGVLPWAHADSSVLRAPIPGVTLAQAAGGHLFATVVGLGVVVSVGGVVIAEYFALNRLLHAISGRSISQMSWLVATGFVGASVLSLIDPSAFYNDLVMPSLIALWVSQLIVFVVYPRFAQRNHNLGPLTVVLAAGASALMAYGLYSAVTSVFG
jgi:hypothetical protein